MTSVACVVTSVAPELDIGQTIELRHGRFAMAAKLATIVGVDLDLGGGTAALELFC